MSSNPAKSEHSNKAPIELFNWLVFDLKKKKNNTTTTTQENGCKLITSEHYLQNTDIPWSATDDSE